MKDIGILIIRLGCGGMMFFSHGLGKLTSFKAKMNIFPDPLGIGSSLSLGLAIFAEVFCAALIMVGLFTRLAAIPLCITMLVAALIVHSADPWAKKEFAFLFLIPFVSLIFLGGGKLSVDRLIE